MTAIFFAVYLNARKRPIFLFLISFIIIELIFFKNSTKIGSVLSFFLVLLL